MSNQTAPISAGTRFGRVVVIGQVESCQRHKGAGLVRNYLCRCDCGTQFERQGILLKKFSKRTRVQSCTPGCAKRLRESEALIRRYKTCAVPRNLVWELTDEQATLLFESCCFYCGSLPSNNYRGYKYNGIDRLDNKEGYTVKNCVACCTAHNFMKGCRFSPEQFVKECLLVAEFNGWKASASPSSLHS